MNGAAQRLVFAWRWPLAFAAALSLHLALFGGGMSRAEDRWSAGPARGVGDDALSVYEVSLGAAAPVAPVATQADPAAGPEAAAATRDAGGGGRDSYYVRVRVHLQRFRQAVGTPISRPMTSVVRFRVESDGAVSAIALDRSSGDAQLDAEALALVHRASPLPAPPRRRVLNLSVPIEFE